MGMGRPAGEPDGPEQPGQPHVAIDPMHPVTYAPVAEAGDRLAHAGHRRSEHVAGYLEPAGQWYPEQSTHRPAPTSRHQFR
jgi:hypothetical protein